MPPVIIMGARTGHYMHDVLELSFGAIPCEGYPQTLSLSFYSINFYLKHDMTGERNTQDSHEEQIHIAGAQVHTSLAALDEQALVMPTHLKLELHEAHVPRANNTIKCTCS